MKKEEPITRRQEFLSIEVDRKIGENVQENLNIYQKNKSSIGSRGGGTKTAKILLGLKATIYLCKSYI